MNYILLLAKSSGHGKHAARPIKFHDRTAGISGEKQTRRFRLSGTRRLWVNERSWPRLDFVRPWTYRIRESTTRNEVSIIPNRKQITCSPPAIHTCPADSIAEFATFINVKGVSPPRIAVSGLWKMSYLKSPENLWKIGGPAKKATSATSAKPNAGTCILRHSLWEHFTWKTIAGDLNRKKFDKTLSGRVFLSSNYRWFLVNIKFRPLNYDR